MENVSSKNSFDMMRKSTKTFKGKWCRAFQASLIFLAPFFIAMLAPVLMIFFGASDTLIGAFMFIGIFIGAGFYGLMQVGYIKYFQALKKGEQGKPFSVFDSFKEKSSYMYFLIGVILCVGYLFGMILLIIPAFYFTAFYSMTLYFASRHEYENVGKAFVKCSSRMKGNKTAMFAYKFVFYGLHLINTSIFIGIGYILKDFYEINPILATCFMLLVLVAHFTVTSLIAMFYQANNTIFFEEIIDYNERKKRIKEDQDKIKKDVQNKIDNMAKSVDDKKE